MQVRPNRAKEILKAGGTILTSSVRLPEPGLCELLGYAGFDFVLLDGEHGTADATTIDRLVQGCFAGNTVPIVRVLRNDDPEAVMHALDLGAQGILLPHCRTAADALQLRSAAFYPPLGNRGFGPGRSTFWGRVDLPTYFETINDKILLLALIEDPEGVDAIDEIAPCGVDVLWVGSGDLAMAYGVPGQRQHPRSARGGRKDSGGLPQARGGGRFSRRLGRRSEVGPRAGLPGDRLRRGRAIRDAGLAAVSRTAGPLTQMRALIIGCGYLGQRVADLWRSAGVDVSALTRSPEHAAELQRRGIEPTVGDVLRPESLRLLPAVDCVLYAVGFDQRAGIEARCLCRWIGERAPGHWLESKPAAVRLEHECLRTECGGVDRRNVRNQTGDRRRPNRARRRKVGAGFLPERDRERAAVFRNLRAQSSVAAD